MKTRPLLAHPLFLLLAASLLALVGCEAVNDGDPDGPDFTLGASCLPPGPGPEKVDSVGAAKRSVPADTTGLQVLFVSADSLRFIVPVQLNCGMKYAFSSSLPSPDTLAIAQRETGGTRAKCTCKKELTVSLKAEAGQSLDKVRVVRTESGTFADFH